MRHLHAALKGHAVLGRSVAHATCCAQVASVCLVNLADEVPCVRRPRLGCSLITACRATERCKRKLYDGHLVGWLELGESGKTLQVLSTWILLPELQPRDLHFC